MTPFKCHGVSNTENWIVCSTSPPVSHQRNKWALQYWPSVKEASSQMAGNWETVSLPWLLHGILDSDLGTQEIILLPQRPWHNRSEYEQINQNLQGTDSITTTKQNTTNPNAYYTVLTVLLQALLSCACFQKYTCVEIGFILDRDIAPAYDAIMLHLVVFKFSEYQSRMNIVRFPIATNEAVLF